jgi:hypothetical protein
VPYIREAFYKLVPDALPVHIGTSLICSIRRTIQWYGYTSHVFAVQPMLIVDIFPLGWTFKCRWANIAEKPDRRPKHFLSQWSTWFVERDLVDVDLLGFGPFSILYRTGILDDSWEFDVSEFRPDWDWRIIDELI